MRDAENREEWDKFIEGHDEANFLQSWDFYEFHKSRGKKIVRRLLIEKGEIVGAYAGVIETAKRGTYMAIAGGPIIGLFYEVNEGVRSQKSSYVFICRICWNN